MVQLGKERTYEKSNEQIETTSITVFSDATFSWNDSDE